MPPGKRRTPRSTSGTARGAIRAGRPTRRGRQPMRSIPLPGSPAAGRSVAPPTLTTAPPERRSAVFHRAPAPETACVPPRGLLRSSDSRVAIRTWLPWRSSATWSRSPWLSRSCARPSSRPCGRRPLARRQSTCVPLRRISGPRHPDSARRTCAGGPGAGAQRIWPAMRPPRHRCLDAPGSPTPTPSAPGPQRQDRAAPSGHPRGRARPADDGHDPRQQCRRGPPRHARDRRMPEISHGQTTVKRS